jgi:hypothetical protein
MRVKGVRNKPKINQSQSGHLFSKLTREKTELFEEIGKHKTHEQEGRAMEIERQLKEQESLIKVG